MGDDGVYIDTGRLMRWQPAHETHSIERVVVSLTLAEPLPSKGWQKVLDDAGRTLPSLDFHPVPDNLAPSPGLGMAAGQFEIMIGPQGVSFGAPPSSSAPVARSFQRVVDGQVQSQLHLTRTTLSLTTSYYERWSAFEDLLLATGAEALSFALDVSSLRTLKLEVWDRFVFDGEAAETDFSELLAADSPFVPRFVSGTPNLWHSHIGFFAPPGSSAQRLINLNLDVVDVAGPQSAELAPGIVEPRRSLGIYTMAQDTLHEDGGPDSIKSVGASLGEMHRALNDLLLAVITSDAARRISLES